MKTPKAKETKSTGRRYGNVREMIAGEQLGESVAAQVEHLHKATSLSRQLAQVRINAGLTQKELADKVGVSQGCISKWESGEDDNLELRVLRYYAQVTSHRFGVSVGRPLNHVEAIKNAVFVMRDHLHSLAALAHKDSEIERHIQKFFSEAFFNIMRILSEANLELPQSNAIEIRSTPESNEIDCEEDATSPREALA
jgi:transcriptional regulator with XRE-family HTH domain